MQVSNKNPSVLQITDLKSHSTLLRSHLSSVLNYFKWVSNILNYHFATYYLPRIILIFIQHYKKFSSSPLPHCCVHNELYDFLQAQSITFGLTFRYFFPKPFFSKWRRPKYNNLPYEICHLILLQDRILGVLKINVLDRSLQSICFRSVHPHVTSNMSNSTLFWN